MSTRNEAILGSIWKQERRDDEQDRRLRVYTSTEERLVLCGACLRLVEERLAFTDEAKEPLATEGCMICGEGR